MFGLFKDKYDGLLGFVSNLIDTKDAKKKAKFKRDEQISEIPQNPNSSLDDKESRKYYQQWQRYYDNYKQYTRTEKIQRAWEDYENSPLVWGVVQQQGFNVTLKNDDGDLFEIHIKIDGKDLGRKFLDDFFNKTYFYKYVDCEVANAFVDGTRFFEFVRDKRTKELIDIVYWEGIKDNKIIEPLYPFPNSTIYQKRHALYWVQSDWNNNKILKVLPDFLVGRITPYTKGGILGDTMLEPVHDGAKYQREFLRDMIKMRPRMMPKIAVTLDTGSGMNANEALLEQYARKVEEDFEDDPYKQTVVSNGEIKSLNPNARNFTDMELNRAINQMVLSGMHIPEGNIAGFAKNVNKSVLDQQSKNQYDGIISSLRDRIDNELVHKAAKTWLLYNMGYPPYMIDKAKITTKWTDKVLQYMQHTLEVEKLQLEKDKFEWEKSKNQKEEG